MTADRDWSYKLCIASDALPSDLPFSVISQTFYETGSMMRHNIHLGIYY